MRNLAPINKLVLSLIIIVLSLQFGFSQNSIKKGKLDISTVNLEEENILLNGEWEFYDEELYTPENFLKENIKTPQYLEVPALWNNSLKRGAKGYGTYRLVIRSLKKNELYAFNIIRIQSSYKLWINGILLHSNGIVGINKENSKPKWSSDDIVFKTDSSEAEIIIQVSNFYHKKGGVENAIVMGTAENITEYSWSISALSIFLLGVLLIMAAYHMAMFVFRKNDKSNLFFALTLIFSAFFTLSAGEILVTKFFPEFNWEILLKIIHSSNYLRVLFFTLFIYVSFKDYLNKFIVKIITVAVLLIQLLIIVTPAYIYSHTLIAFFIITAFVLVYLIIGQIKALAHRKAGALFSFLGIILLLLTVVNDVLKEFQVIQSVYLSSFGIFIFIIFHSYLISIQNSKAYRTIKNYTDNLIIQGKIKDAFFSAKSYDLKNPLKSIADGVDADRALIFIVENNEWIATNEYIKSKNISKRMKVKMFSAKENVYFSARSIKKAISTKVPVYTLLSTKLKSSELNYFEERGVVSVFAYPFVKDEKVPAILYFENYIIKPKFDKISTRMSDTILPQVLIFMDNYSSYGELKKFNENLEQTVHTVTQDIQIKNKELKLLRADTEEHNTQVNILRQNLEKQNQEISDGIRYAEKIQFAFLPKETQIKNTFPDSFIFNKPKNILSGDFFWFKELNENESIYIVADSTGHGVSGALMSIIGHELLNDTVIYQNIKSPKIILNTIQKNFTERISKNKEIGGIDLAVIYYDSSKNEIVFSGAQNSICLVHNNSIIEYKGTPFSIGENDIISTKGTSYYKNYRMKIEKGDVVYMFTDGFSKQIGFETGRKFLKKRFKELLLKIHNETGDIQKKIVEKTLYDWQGEEEQIDDILVTGIRF